MHKLKYYKMKHDVTDPVFATSGSACFDMFCYICEQGRITTNTATPLVTIYTMDNKKELRECHTWAGKRCEFNTGFELYPGERVLVPTGLIFNIPEGHSVRLHTRSSISLKKGLIMPNGEGIIDSDYYHQTFVMLYNASADEVLIKPGERIAQGELIKTLSYSIEETEDVPEQKTNRVGGFGSTGVK